MREISHSIQNDKQVKKCVDCTVRTDVDVANCTTHGRCVGSRVDESTYDTWLVCGKWDGDMWPNQWSPRVT